MDRSSISDLITVLDMVFPRSLPLSRGLCTVATLASIIPLFLLHKNQHRQPRQLVQTAWMKSITNLFYDALGAGEDPEVNIILQPDGEGPEMTIAQNLSNNLEGLFEFLGLETPEGPEGPHPRNIFPLPRLVLITSQLNCLICPPGEIHALRRHEKPQRVRVLEPNFKWTDGDFFVAHCPGCRSDYYPDKYTFKVDGHRQQKLEYETEYLRVSKSGVWMHRRVAIAQEKAMNRFHAGWSNFGSWLNDILHPDHAVTNRQSQRLFLEHFARRLLLAHGKENIFICEAHPASSTFAERVRDVIGCDGGVVPGALHHGCIECTHKKRYRSDLEQEGVDFQAANEAEVAGLEEVVNAVSGGLIFSILCLY